MAETQWGEEVEEQKVTVKKRGVPVWVWGCGGGCLLLLVLAVAGAGLGFNWLKDEMSPEKSRERVAAELVPADGWPEGVVVQGGGFMGQRQYMFEHDEYPSFMGKLYLYSEGSRSAGEPFMDPESAQNKGIMGLGEITNARTGTVELQGRDVAFIRYDMWLPGEAKEQGATGASIRVDISHAETGPYRMFELMRLDDGADVDDEELRGYLAGFDVWATEPKEGADSLEAGIGETEVEIEGAGADEGAGGESE